MFLRDAKYQQLISSMAQKTRSHSAPGKQGGDPLKPKEAAFIDGVQVEFLEQNKLCMNFNKET